MVRRGFLFSLIAVIALIPSAMGIKADTQEDIYTNGIYATARVTYNFSYKDIFGTELKGMAGGSGVLIAPNQVITCYHIFSDNPVGTIMLMFRTDKEQIIRTEVKIIKDDPKLDLVILEFTPPVTKITPIRIAEKVPALGDDIFLVGHTVFPVTRLRFLHYVESLQGIMVSPIYLGDSGGGVFNLHGELIGLVQLVLNMDNAAGEYTTFIGYAIPLDVIREFMNGREEAMLRP